MLKISLRLAYIHTQTHTSTNWLTLIHFCLVQLLFPLCYNLGQFRHHTIPKQNMLWWEGQRDKQERRTAVGPGADRTKGECCYFQPPTHSWSSASKITLQITPMKTLRGKKKKKLMISFLAYLIFPVKR